MDSRPPFRPPRGYPSTTMNTTTAYLESPIMAPSTLDCHCDDNSEPSLAWNSYSNQQHLPVTSPHLALCDPYASSSAFIEPAPSLMVQPQSELPQPVSLQSPPFPLHSEGTIDHSHVAGYCQPQQLPWLPDSQTSLPIVPVGLLSLDSPLMIPAPYSQSSSRASGQSMGGQGGEQNIDPALTETLTETRARPHGHGRKSSDKRSTRVSEEMGESPRGKRHRSNAHEYQIDASPVTSTTIPTDLTTISTRARASSSSWPASGTGNHHRLPRQILPKPEKPSTSPDGTTEQPRDQDRLDRISDRDSLTAMAKPLIAPSLPRPPTAPSVSPTATTAATMVATATSAATSDESRRERNRAAASRCRERSKAEAGRLESERRTAEQRRAWLTAAAAGLEGEVRELRGLLGLHVGCDCVLIRQYLRNVGMLEDGEGGPVDGHDGGEEEGNAEMGAHGNGAGGEGDGGGDDDDTIGHGGAAGVG